MHVLVTGGAGFIGSAVVDELVRDGHEVTVIDVLLEAAHRDKPDYLASGATYHWIDVRDRDAVGNAIDHSPAIDAVCHQAAMVGLGVNFADVEEYVAHNDQGTAALLRALHDRRFGGRLVLASSMVVYGEGRYQCGIHGIVRPGARTAQDLDAGHFEPRCPLCGGDLVARAVPEDAPVDPRNVYAATKLHQEHLCQAYSAEHGGSTISLRYHNVYGPRMPRETPYAGVASIFRSAAEAGRAPQVFEDGGQRRDFVHVGDVARANLIALGAPTSVEGPFNVCTGEPHTVLEMATALTDAVGGAVPAPVVVGGGRIGDVRHVFASAERAREVLGFAATKSFADGMTEFAHVELRS